MDVAYAGYEQQLDFSSARRRKVRGRCKQWHSELGDDERGWCHVDLSHPSQQQLLAVSRVREHTLRGCWFHLRFVESGDDIRLHIHGDFRQQWGLGVDEFAVGVVGDVVDIELVYSVWVQLWWLVYCAAGGG